MRWRRWREEKEEEEEEEGEEEEDDDEEEERKALVAEARASEREDGVGTRRGARSP